MAVAVHSSAVAFCIGAELVAKGGGLEIITHGKYWLFKTFLGVSKKSVVIYIGILRYVNEECKNVRMQTLCLFPIFKPKYFIATLSLVTPFGVLIGLAVTAQISEVIFVI